MTTAKPHQPGPRRRRLRNSAFILVAIVAGLAFLSWHRLHAQAVVATSYAARIACTCHYIEGRNLTDCRKDFEPGMALVTLDDNPAQHGITARIPLVASQSAALHEGAGCVLQSWVP